MSRVLIVGSGSPLGQSILTEMRVNGHEVLCASRSGSGNADVVDITDPAAAHGLLQRTQPEVVVYLARPDLASEDSGAIAAAVSSGVMSVQAFATQCHAAGVDRFVFASSAAVYGTSHPAPFSESSATPAPGPYAQLKILSEQSLAEVSRDTTMAMTALRIFNIYGPGFGLSLINRLMAPENQPTTLFVTDRFVRDYVHTQDVAHAFALAAEGAAVCGTLTILNVGTGVGMSNKTLSSLVPHANWRAGDGLATDSISVADISQIHTAWGFEPQVRLENALRNPEKYLR